MIIRAIRVTRIIRVTMNFPLESWTLDPLRSLIERGYQVYYK